MKTAAAVCLALVLAAGIGVVVSLRSVGKVIGDFAAHPDRTAAMETVSTSLRVDLVRTDDAAATMTVRDRLTGEERTVSFADAAAGNFGTTLPPVAEGPLTGVATGGTLPAWVPEYPGAARQGEALHVEKLESIAGAFTARSADAPVKVKGFYETKLKDAGFTVESDVTDGKGSAMINGKDATNRTLMILITAGEADTSVVVNYEGPK